jgi:hypothetical protein
VLYVIERARCELRPRRFEVVPRSAKLWRCRRSTVFERCRFVRFRSGRIGVHMRLCLPAWRHRSARARGPASTVLLLRVSSGSFRAPATATQIPADSVPGFWHELLPGVAGILTIPALFGLAGRFARALAPNGRPGVWGMGASAAGGFSAVLRSQREVASCLRSAGAAPVIPGADPAGRAEPGPAHAWPPFPAQIRVRHDGRRHAAARSLARALLTPAGTARRGGSRGRRAGRRCCCPARLHGPWVSAGRRRWRTRRARCRPRCRR